MSVLKIALHSFRFIVGILFVFSGFVKLVDPTGTAIKLEEYFETFSVVIAPFFELLMPHALFFSVFLSTLEVVLGVALLLFFRMRVTTTTILVLMLFFTGLTYYSASCDPKNEAGVSCVTDCGCFGDAMPLEPWQSFTKDVILLLMVIPLFIYRKKLKSGFDNGTGAFIVGLIAVMSLIFAHHNLNHLPLIDFRPYAEGLDIKEKMNNGKPGEYEYVMKKDGKEKTFEKYPTGEEAEGYEFVEMKTVKEPESPDITDFAAFNKEGEDKTEFLLTGKKLYVVCYKLNKVKEKQAEDMARLMKDVSSKTDIDPVLVMSADFESVQLFREQYGIDVAAYSLDETVIKAMIRSNPGYMLLEDGVVRGKWHYQDIPTAEQLKQLLD